eukprot:Gb_31940 [translate_table: standard]
METNEDRVLKNAKRRAHPSVEIELVDESSENEVVDACPESVDSPQNEEKQGEPTLYKRVIYIPTNTNGTDQVQQQQHSMVSPKTLNCFNKVIDVQEVDGDDNTDTIPQTRGRCDNEDIQCESVLVTEPAAVEPNRNNTMISNTHELTSYWKQWADGLNPRVILSAFLVLVMSFVWILAVGSWLASRTGDMIGTAEVFLSTFLCGTLFAVCGSQPILIVGVSIPSLVFVSGVFSTADRLSLKFVPWMGWIAIWGAVVLAILACLKPWTMSLVDQLTQFSWEIVQMFVGLTFLWHGVEETIHFFTGDATNDSALLSLWLVTCSLLLGILLDGARHSHFLSWRYLRILADFGPTFIVLALIALPGIPKWSRIKLSQVKMPSWGYHSDDIMKMGALVKLKAVPFWAIFLAVIPGALLAALVLIDHDSTSTFLSSDSEESRKQKHISRRRDLLTLAVILLLCGLLGLPFCYGLFPQSIRHICVLTHKMSISSSDLERRDIFIPGHSRGKVRVQRVSSLLISLIIGIPLLPKVSSLLKKVPQPLLLGYCLQMGLLSFRGLRLSDYLRIAIFKGSAAEGPSLVAVRLYIITQIGCVATIFAVSCTQAALIFPLFLLTAVWLRHCVMGRVFQKPEFEILDKKLFVGKQHDTSPDPSLANPSDTCQQQVHSWFQSNTIPASEGESSGSSFSQHSLPLPSEVKTRRLKERSLRRKKRKRHDSSFEAGGHVTSITVSGEETTKSRHSGHKRDLGSWSSLSSSLRFLRGTKDDPPSLSSLNDKSKGHSRFPKRARNMTVCLSLKGGDVDIDLDMHSNILYDPYWGDAIVISTENAMFNESKGENVPNADVKPIIMKQQQQQFMSLDKPEQMLSLMGSPEIINGSEVGQQQKLKQQQQQEELCMKNINEGHDALVVNRLRRATVSFDEWANASDSLPVAAVSFSSGVASTSASTSCASSSSSPTPIDADTICIGPVLPYALLIPAHSLANTTQRPCSS